MDEKKVVTSDEIRQKLTDLINLNEIEALIKSNEQIFDVQEVSYRIKKATSKQKQEAYVKRVEKFTELLKDKKYILENELKKIYLERGIDIDDMVKTIANLIVKRDRIMVQLGEMIKNGSPDNELETFKNEIIELNSIIQSVSIKKTSLLELSIEQQVMVYTLSHLTYLLVEKKDGENWVKCWNTLDEFEQASEELINRCTYYVTVMSGLIE